MLTSTENSGSALMQPLLETIQSCILLFKILTH